VNCHFTHEAHVVDFVMTASTPPLALRSIPATGQTVPVLGLGCAALGNLYAPMTDAEAAATLAAAAAGRIAYFDTAPYYGHGLSETRLGQYLRGVAGEAVMVSSKVGRSLRPAGVPPTDTGFVDAAPFEPYFDYRREAVLVQVEESLGRLGRERLDLAFVHDIGAQTHGAAHAERFDEALKGAFPALQDLKARGTVGAVGIGVNEVAVCLEVLDRIELDVILLAGRYTLLDQSAAQALLPLCLRRGVAVVVGGPFNSGLLAGGAHFDYAPAPPAIVARAARIGEVCARHGVALAAAALHFVLRHPAVVSVIPGARHPAEVRANLDHLASPPPPELWDALAAEGLIDSASP
jgi:D-threo-aldose 1-dehydrogenase